TFKNDVKRSFVASQKDFTAADFNRANAVQQAWVILKNGTPEMKKNVILNNDPLPLNEFRTIQTSVLGACAACHTADKTKGNFVLKWPALSDPDRFTNFVILQQYQKKVGDKTYSMIDRNRPEDSLFLQFMLPPVEQRGANAVPGVVGHPNLGNYRGVVKTVSDARFLRVYNWISSLNVQQTLDYNDFDLSSPPGTTPSSTTVPPPPVRP